MGSRFDWSYATEPEPGLALRRIGVPRGRVHGGSSAINAMVHVRGHRQCFDGWRALGNPGWGFDDLLPLFKRSERNDEGASNYRGIEGPLSVSHCLDPHAGHHAFLAAAAEQGFQADPRYDFNLPEPEGVAGFYQRNILNGRRHSAAAAFLAPAMKRSNVDVRSGAHAVRLMREGRRVVGVEYVQDGHVNHVRAEREVVVCAGAVDSPRLLMLSGIGPADHLRTSGIEPIVDLPGVGRNLQDHLKLSLRWEGRTTLPGSTVTAGLFTSSHSTSPPDLQFYVGRGLEQSDDVVTITVSLRAAAVARVDISAVCGSARGAGDPRQLPSCERGCDGVHSRSAARSTAWQLTRIRRAQSGRDGAWSRTHNGCRSGAIHSPEGRHDLSPGRNVSHGTRGRPGGSCRRSTPRARHRRGASGGRVGDAGGRERSDPCRVRRDRREVRRADYRPMSRPLSRPKAG